MDNEVLRRYYLDQDYNCAEAILRAANDEFCLGLSDDALGLVGAFGGGMGCGDTCGALAGSMAVLSRVFITDRAHRTEGFSDVCKSFHESFLESLGAGRCAVLKERDFVDGCRCLKVVEETYNLLREFINERSQQQIQ